MPELPDVAVFKQYLDATSLHQRITGVEVRDRRLLEGIGPRKLASRLGGTEIASSRRHGKHLLAILDNGSALALHFGMTGDLAYYRNPEAEPRYAQLVMTFRGGYHLAYNSRRRLGEIRLIDDVDDFAEENELGPDALEVSRDAFYAALKGRRGLKASLMDQRHLAGIGNVYSDEILFQAGILPTRQGDDLNGADRKRLYSTMRRVLRTVIRHQADPGQLPRTYLTRNREEGAPCPKCSGKVKTKRVGGRRAYYCPNCQR